VNLRNCIAVLLFRNAGRRAADGRRRTFCSLISNAIAHARTAPTANTGACALRTHARTVTGLALRAWLDFCYNSGFVYAIRARAGKFPAATALPFLLLMMVVTMVGR